MSDRTPGSFQDKRRLGARGKGFLFVIELESFGCSDAAPLGLKTERNDARSSYFVSPKGLADRPAVHQAALLPLGIQAALQLHGRADRKSTRLNSSHQCASRMPSPA